MKPTLISKAIKKPAICRVFPCLLQVRNEPRNDQEIEGAFPHYLIGDARRCGRI